MYGAETGGARVLGGLSSSTPARQWYCPHVAVGRFYMQCAHGHRGQVMPLCQSHYQQYAQGVKFCPRCNSNDDKAHKCELTLVHIS